MKKCAVIVAAYNADKYILETLKSLWNQKVPSGWEIKIYIGVDACKKTFHLLRSNQINFYHSPRNVGTYVIANSLIQLAKDEGFDDVVARFDSDDIANPNYFVNGLNLVQTHGYVRSIVMPLKHTDLLQKHFYSNGQFFITKDALSVVNGFDDYIVSADHALMLKMRANGYDGLSSNTIDLDTMPSLLKRWHSGSLSSHPELGKHSEARALIHNEIDQKIKNKDFFVASPKIVKLIKH